MKSGGQSVLDDALVGAVYAELYSLGYGEGADLFIKHFQEGKYENSLNPRNKDRTPPAYKDGLRKARHPEDIDS